MAKRDDAVRVPNHHTSLDGMRRSSLRVQAQEGRYESQSLLADAMSATRNHTGEDNQLRVPATENRSHVLTRRMEPPSGFMAPKPDRVLRSVSRDTESPRTGMVLIEANAQGPAPSQSLGTRKRRREEDEDDREQPCSILDTIAHSKVKPRGFVFVGDTFPLEGPGRGPAAAQQRCVLNRAANFVC